MQADELKRRIAKERAGRAYPADLRHAIVEYGILQKARGSLWREIGEELGVHEQTIRYWKKLERKRGGSDGTMTQVEVVTDIAPRSREVIVECGAFRVRGLDLDGAAELLRRLA